MKQNPDYVMGYKAPRYICKVHLDRWHERIIWWLFRRYLLNEDRYKVRRMFTGPRPISSHFTRKEHATAYRYYIEERRPKNYRAAWRDVVTPIRRPTTHYPPKGVE